MSNAIGLLAGIGNTLNAADDARLKQAQNASIGTAGQAAKILFAVDPTTGQATQVGTMPSGAVPSVPGAGPGAPAPIGPMPSGSMPGSPPSPSGAPAANLAAPVPQMPTGTPPNPAGLPQQGAPQGQLTLQAIMSAIKQSKPNISPEELWMTLNQFQPMLSSQDKQIAEALKVKLQDMKDMTTLQNGANKNSTNITIQGMKGDTAVKTTGMKDDTAEDVAATRADAAETVQGMKGDSAKDIQSMKGEQKLNEIKARAAAAVKSGVLTGAQKAQMTALQKRADAENQTVQSLIRSGTGMDDPALQAALTRRNAYMDQLAGMLSSSTPPALPRAAAGATPPTADAPSGVTVEEVK